MGIGLFGIGTAIGCRVADVHLFGVLLSGIMASTVSLVALALFASSQVAVVALAFVLGLSPFFTAPALNARISVAGAAPHPGRCDDHGRVQLGSTSGPWLGGTVIEADFGFAAWAGASMTMTVLVLVAVSFSLRLPRGRPVPPVA